MDKEAIVTRTAEHIRSMMEGEGSGHDWWHVYRVWQTARHLAASEQADLFVVELAALLHDIADWKFHNGDETAGPRAAREWLESLGVEEAIVAHVCSIIEHLSFKGAGVENKISTKEGMAAQDADRLDAIGAIGIARAFAYGGHVGRLLYDPELPPQPHASFEEYKKNESPTVNHFYEKLLLLKDRMNTEAGKRLAEGRHRYMEEYLERFYKEWEGKL